MDVYICSEYLTAVMPETESPIDTYIPTGAGGRIELYLRSLAPAPGNSIQNDSLDALRQLEESDRLDSVRARVWGDSICTKTPEISGLTDMLETITRIYSFSAENDPTVTPFFSIRRVDSSLADESFERIVPPQRTLLTYQDGSLIGVFPCLIDNRNHTPVDAIERLETLSDISISQTAETTSPRN